MSSLTLLVVFSVFGPKSDQDMKIYEKDNQNYYQSTSKLRARRSEIMKKPKFLEKGGFCEKLGIPGSMKLDFLLVCRFFFSINVPLKD